MKRTILTLMAVNIFALLAKADPAPLAVGDPAPEVTGIDQNGKAVNFADVYAKGITLVYFYPKAGTGGCTKQACSLRDGFGDLTAKGIQVIGVSHDDVGAQKKFEEKYQLPFTLIADKDGKVAEAFKVGLLPGGFTKRESFLIKDGKVAWVELKAKTEGHAEQVREAADALK